MHGGMELKQGQIFSPMAGSKSGGWCEGGDLGSKRAQMRPKSRRPYLLQKKELGQTKKMYDGLLEQAILLVTLF